MAQPKVNIADNYEDFCEKVTQEILIVSNEKIETQGKFTIVLSGGATPKGIYQRMASASYRERFNWEKIHFFWSDERWVPPEDLKSNYRMASEALLAKVKIPSRNINPIQTKNCSLQASARLYEENISGYFKLKKDEFPPFDLILLGVGQDGHTSSLFPGNPALLEKNRLVVPVSQEGISEKRITLTLPVINHAGIVFFLARGDEKASIVAEILEDQKGQVFPANAIAPSHGKICWFLDKASASKLRIA